MAKRKQTTEAATEQENGQPEGENISGYFRKVFGENPKWLEGRSNDEVLARWLKDHPGETEVPKRVKQNLSNVKSNLRQAQRRSPAHRRRRAGPPSRPPPSLRPLVRACGGLSRWKNKLTSA